MSSQYNPLASGWSKSAASPPVHGALPYHPLAAFNSSARSQERAPVIPNPLIFNVLPSGRFGIRESILVYLTFLLLLVGREILNSVIVNQQGRIEVQIVTEEQQRFTKWIDSKRSNVASLHWDSIPAILHVNGLLANTELRSWLRSTANHT